MDCYYQGPTCDNRQDSREHVILDTFGGTIAIRGALCKNCNQLLGKTIDAEAYDLIGLFSDLIIKDSDKQVRIPMYAKDGDKIYVGQGMIQFNRFVFYPTDKEVTLFLPPNGDMKVFAKRKMTEMGLNEENVKFTEGEELRNEKLWYFRNKLSGETFQLAIGGKSYVSHILKTAINFYLYSKLDRGLITESFKMLRNNDPTNTYMYYPDHYLPYSPEKNEISHILYLVADPDRESIYCYIELFNFDCYLVILSRNYNGSYKEQQYIIDIARSKQVMNNSISIKLTKAHLDDFDIIHKFSIGKFRMGRERKLNALTKKIEDLQEVI